jgi:polyisoprenoid-binding protein YceI
MNPFKSPLVLKVFVLALAFTGSASAAWVVQGQKQVSFRAVGPGGLAIVGNASELSVKEQGSDLAVTVGLQGLKTGIDLRDNHMKEKYLETQKYPTAVLVVDRSKLTIPTSGADVNGTLTLHGTTKPVRVHYEATGTAKQAHIEGEFSVNMKEFGISVPSYLGVTVKPVVQVTAKFDSLDR